MTIEAHVVHFQHAHQIGVQVLQIGFDDLAVPAFGEIAKPEIEVL